MKCIFFKVTLGNTSEDVNKIIYISDVFNKRTTQSIYNYWEKYKLIPINLVNNKCIILNFETKEEYIYDGQIVLHYNQFKNDYEYELVNGETITLITFEPNNKKSTCNNKLIFDVELKNDEINISASNSFETYTTIYQYNEHTFIKDIDIMYNIVNDALSNKNDNVSYEYEIENDNLILCVNIDMIYYKDVLEFKLEKVNNEVDRMDILQKKVALLWDMYNKH